MDNEYPQWWKDNVEDRGIYTMADARKLLKVARAEHWSKGNRMIAFYVMRDYAKEHPRG